MGDRIDGRPANVGKYGLVLEEPTQCSVAECGPRVGETPGLCNEADLGDRLVYSLDTLLNRSSLSSSIDRRRRLCDFGEWTYSSGVMKPGRPTTGDVVAETDRGALS